MLIKYKILLNTHLFKHVEMEIVYFLIGYSLYSFILDQKV